MKPILTVENLTKRYATFVLDNVSFSLDRGFIMGLIGPNGAGKTTIIKLILNLIRRDEGRIELFGKEHPMDGLEAKQRIGFVFDQPSWYETFTLGEMSRVIAPLYRNWQPNLFSDYLRRFELDPAAKIESLSKGMKMKYSLAVALSHKAELIIMDEPTSGLDPIFRNDLLTILQENIAKENTSVLFSSHITSDLEKAADYITFVNHGKLVFSCSKEEVNDMFCVVRGGEDLIDRDIGSMFISVYHKNNKFSGLSLREPEIRVTYKEYLQAGKIVIDKPNLEEIMLLTVKGEEDVESGV